MVRRHIGIVPSDSYGSGNTRNHRPGQEFRGVGILEVEDLEAVVGQVDQVVTAGDTPGKP